MSVAAMAVRIPIINTRRIDRDRRLAPTPDSPENSGERDSTAPVSTMADRDGDEVEAVDEVSFEVSFFGNCPASSGRASLASRHCGHPSRHSNADDATRPSLIHFRRMSLDAGPY